MQDNQDHADLFLFLASAAHDMKNSVGMLNGTLEVLLKDPVAKTIPAYQQVAHMLYETRRINNNLIQLLALYKDVGTPSYPFDPQQHAIADFAEDIEAQNRLLLDSKGIAFESIYPSDLLWYFDEYLVAGIVSHAINNAIHYTTDQVQLVIQPVDDFLEFRIEDNGCGYPPMLLEAGGAAQSGVNFMTGSTGLGLRFASEAAKMHKHRGRRGSIALENGGTWGGGCFVLRLP